MPTIEAGNRPNLDSKFPARDIQALKNIVAQYRPWLLQRARYRMPDAPPDICEEAVQELSLDLWGRGAGDYDPTRGSMKTYLMGRLQTAIRHVRANYTPAGERTRRTCSTCNEVSVTAQESSRPSITFDDNSDVVNTDEALNEPSSGAWSARVDNEFDVKAIMTRAARVRLDDALARIHGDEDSLVKVAHDKGIARTTLDYRLRKFYEAERAAA